MESDTPIQDYYAQQDINDLQKLKIQAMKRQFEQQKMRDELLQQWLNPPQYFSGPSGQTPIDVGGFSTGGAPMERIGIGPGGIVPQSQIHIPNPAMEEGQTRRKKLAQRILLGLPEQAPEDVQEFEMKKLEKQQAGREQLQQEKQVFTEQIRKEMEELKSTHTKELEDLRSRHRQELEDTKAGNRPQKVDPALEYARKTLGSDPNFQMADEATKAAKLQEFSNIIRATMGDELQAPEEVVKPLPEDIAQLPPPDKARPNGKYRIGGREYRSDGRKWRRIT